MKRGVYLLLVLLTIAILVFTPLASAQEDGGQDSNSDLIDSASDSVDEITELDTPEKVSEEGHDDSNDELEEIYSDLEDDGQDSNSDLIDSASDSDDISELDTPEKVSEEGHDDSNDKLEEIYSDLEDEDFNVDPGLTPDSALYGLDNFLEEQLIGDNPERALRYKEEKIAEAKYSIEQGNPEQAKEVLERVENYGDILEREVSPDIEKRARQSSKSVKELLKEIEADLEGEEWDGVKEKIKDQQGREDKIAVAAKISSQIKDLCNTLSEIDPLEYSRVCSVDDNSPKWQRTLNEDLTKEQKKEAEEFFKVMSSCFENPAECECNKISIDSFANQCSIIAPLAADCEDGDESACQAMEEIEDPIDLLPDYLQNVMEQVERRYNDDRFDLHMPRECREEGAKTREQCEKIMFKTHAPQECVDALDRGEIKFNGEREARNQCERVMFEQNAPPECIEAGLKDHRGCEKLMFKQNAPPECVESGLTGNNRLDNRKCEELMRRMNENEGQDHGFGGGNCKNIKDSKERLACYDGATQGLQNFKENGGPPRGWPEPCEKAGARDRDSCEQVMRKFGEEQRNRNEERFAEQRNSYQDYYKDDGKRFEETMEREKACVQRCSSEGQGWDFSNGVCKCLGGDQKDYEQDHRDDYSRDQPPEFDDRRYEDESFDGEERDNEYLDQSPEGYPNKGDYSNDKDYQKDNPNNDYQSSPNEGSHDEPSSGEDSGGSGSDSGSGDPGSSDSGSSNSGGDSGSDSGSSDGGEAPSG